MTTPPKTLPHDGNELDGLMNTDFPAIIDRNMGYAIIL